MTLSDDIERLRRVPLLSVLDEEGLRHLAFNADFGTLADGEILFYIGDHATGALLITRGSLSLQKLVAGEMRERARLAVDGILDPHALISDVRRGYTAQAVGETDYLTLDRATFLKIMQAYPELAERVQDYLADNIEHLASSLQDVADRLDNFQ